MPKNLPGLPEPIRRKSQDTFVILDCPGRYGPRGARNNERCTPTTIGQNFKGIVCRCALHERTYTVKPDGTLTKPIVAKETRRD